MKKFTYSICIISLILCFCSCSSNSVKKAQKHVPKEKDRILDIVTTNKFTNNIIKEIVKDKHIVEYMFNEKENYIDYSYTEDSLYNISKQDLFIYSGVDLEPWIDEFVSKVKKNKVGIINISRGAKIIPYETNVKYKDKELTDNPYYWLNVDNYKIMLLNVKNAIEDKDPKNRQQYEHNFYECIKKLEKLQKQTSSLQEELKECIFIVGEDKLDYFTSYCDLNVIKLKSKNNDLNNGENTQNNENGENKTNDENDNVKDELQNIINTNKDKKVIFLYSDESLKKYEENLKQFNIQEIKIKTDDYKNSYINFMNENIKALKLLGNK